MGKRGKKKTKEERQALLMNLRDGLTIVAACAQAGIGEATYYYWLKQSGEDGEWAKEVEAAHTFAEAVFLSKVKKYADLKEDGRLWLSLLERRFPNRWGPKREVEVNVNNPSQQANEMVLKMIEQSNQAYAAPQVEESDDESGP
tara:strand:+ start:232 stop:663 length:432 start_codon:yes stop_codon:yes gene_type:complete